MAVVGDIYHIEERLQEMDPEISLMFDNGKYHVFHRDYYVMAWPWPLDCRLLQHMRKIDLQRGSYDPFREVEEYNEKVESGMDKQRYNTLEDTVKYYHPKIRNDIDGIQMKTVF